MNFNNTKISYSALFLISILLSACGGGGGLPASGTAPGTNSVAAAIRSSAPLSSCPNGGISVDAGIDTNGNGVLDTTEVTSTQYVCNGANGTSGTSGTDGLTVLVSVTDELAGANCTSGGKKVSAGKDANTNNVLDASEVSSTAYVCNGATGSAGTNGTNGTNGLNTLVAIVSESAGANCASGGSKATSGLDTNANGILDAGEITSTTYVCNGATGATGPAGPGVSWVNVTGTTQQAASNTGYMANNAAQVTITLPPTPTVGDVVQVSGIGSGGWKIAQNAGQYVITKDIVSSIGAV